MIDRFKYLQHYLNTMSNHLPVNIDNMLAAIKQCLHYKLIGVRHFQLCIMNTINTFISQYGEEECHVDNILSLVVNEIQCYLRAIDWF